MDDTRSRLKSDPVLRWDINQDSHHAGFKVLPNFSSRGEYAGGVQGQLQALVLAPLAHPCKVPVLFPFWTRVILFFLPFQHPEKSARRQTQQPDRTIAFLLGAAFRIKEDISACLQGTHGFRKEESLARKLLETTSRPSPASSKNSARTLR